MKLTRRSKIRFVHEIVGLGAILFAMNAIGLGPLHTPLSTTPAKASILDGLHLSAHDAAAAVQAKAENYCVEKWNSSKTPHSLIRCRFRADKWVEKACSREKFTRLPLFRISYRSCPLRFGLQYKSSKTGKWFISVYLYGCEARVIKGGVSVFAIIGVKCTLPKVPVSLGIFFNWPPLPGD